MLAGGSYSCNGNTDNPIPDDPVVEEVKDRGFSAGAKAGIAIGTIAAVALLAAAGFFIYRWRKRRLTPTEPNDHGNAEAAPPYRERSLGHDRKHDFEMEFYSVQPHYEGSSQKELIDRGGGGGEEMGRPSMGAHPGPEGRHEMFNTKDPPAAHELPASDIDKEGR